MSLTAVRRNAVRRALTGSVFANASPGVAGVGALPSQLAGDQPPIVPLPGATPVAGQVTYTPAVARATPASVAPVQTPAPVVPAQAPASLATVAPTGNQGSSHGDAGSVAGGAAVGAAIGSALFPGVGTVLGGIGGGLYGWLGGGDDGGASAKDRLKLNNSTTSYLSGLGLTPENQAQITQALGYVTRDMTGDNMKAAYASYVPQLATAVLANQQQQGYNTEFNRQADARSAALQTYLMPALQQASAYTKQQAGSYASALSAAAGKVDDPQIRAALMANAQAVPANAALADQGFVSQIGLSAQAAAQARADQARLNAVNVPTAQQTILQALGPDYAQYQTAYATAAGKKAGSR